MTAPTAIINLAGLSNSSGGGLQNDSGLTSRSGGSIQANGGPSDYGQSQFFGSRTTGTFGMARGWSSIPTSAVVATLLNDAGTEVIRLIGATGPVIKLQFWNGASWTDVGSMTGLSASDDQQRYYIEFDGLGTSSGLLRYRTISSADVLVGTVQGTGLNLTSVTNVAAIRIYTGLNGFSDDNEIGEIFLKDGIGSTAIYVYGQRPNANGTDNTDGTGSYTDVDDTSGLGLTDFITLPSAANKRSFKSAARSFGGRFVKGVSASFLVRRGATGPTGVKAYLLIGGTRYYHPVGTVTLPDTNWHARTFDWELNPVTSAPWLEADAADANLEYGLEAA